MDDNKFEECPWDKDTEFLKEDYNEMVNIAVNNTSNEEDRLYGITIGEMVWEIESSMLDTLIDFLIEVADARTVTERYIDND